MGTLSKLVDFSLFEETVRELPYDEKNEIVMENMKEPKFASIMVSLNNNFEKGEEEIFA